MAKETLKEQNERLLQELKEARAQIQQLQRDISTLNDENNVAYEKSSYYKADQACIRDLKNQVETLKSQLSHSREEKRKVDEEIRSLNNLERNKTVKNMGHVEDIISDISKDSDYYKTLTHELEVAHSDYRRLKYVNDQLEENNEVLKQRVEDLEHSVKERHKETVEAYQEMEEYTKHYASETRELQKKVWALQAENKKLIDRSGNTNKKSSNAGRKKNDKTYMKRYNTFCDLIWKGMSMEDIMGTMEISRRTYFRFLKHHREDCQIDAIHDEIIKSSNK